MKRMESLTCTYSVRAEVVDFHAVLRLASPCRAFDDVQHRLEAIADVEIGFPLRAVAEDFQVVGMLAQLLVKIEDVAVRVAFAENRDEPENVALETEAFAVGVNACPRPPALDAA